MTDDIDQRLINALMADSRLSLKALAQVSGLSAPSVAERLRKLEERGVIRGYTLDVDPAVSATNSRRSCASAPCPAGCTRSSDRSRTSPSSPSATRSPVTTASSPASRFVRWNRLDTLLDRINGYAETNTAIVKKSPVKRRLPPMT